MNRISHEQEGQRIFVDALREALGLEPLYRPAREAARIRVYPDFGTIDYGCRQISSSRAI